MRFQGLALGTTADDIIEIGIEVAKTGSVTRGDEFVFVRQMQIGVKWVKVKTVLTRNNELKVSKPTESGSSLFGGEPG